MFPEIEISSAKNTAGVGSMPAGIDNLITCFKRNMIHKCEVT